MTRRGWALFAAMALIWGIPYLLIKVAVADLTPATLVFFRTTIGALVLVPFVLARGGVRPLIPHWRPLVAYTIVEVAVPWFLLSDAERRLTSSLTGLLVAAVPLIGTVLMRLTRGDERFDPRRVMGLLIGFIGVAALLRLNVSGSDLGAVAEVGLVAVGYATGPMLISRKLAGVPSAGVVATSLVLTALVYAPIGIAQMPRRSPAGSVLLAVAILGLICTAVAFLVFFALIAEVGPVRATIITYFNPVVALALGVSLLHEPLTIGMGLGLGLVLLGSYFATRPGRSAARLPSRAAATG